MKKHVVIRLFGGLGNQIFIYAFGFALAKRLNRELLIDDISGFGDHRDEYKSEYALGDLKISADFLSGSKWRFLLGNKYFWWMARRINLSYTEPSPREYEAVLSSKVCFFEGYWQSYRYFYEYAEDLKKEFSVRDPNSKKISRLRDEIRSQSNTVAIGMRFYEETATASQTYVIQDHQFYSRAIVQLERAVSNPIYYVFTTDPSRARCVMEKTNASRVVFVEPVLEKSMVSSDFDLMSKCDHFIISNGTFYWWAAYLGESTDSVVIAPKKGFVNEDCLPPHWRTV